MKKIYLSILAVACAVGANAQQQGRLHTKEAYGPESSVKPKPQIQVSEKATLIWDDEFDVPANWTLTNNSAGPTLDFSFETNPDIQALNVSAVPAELTPFASNSASNGFLFVSSDAATGNGDNDGTPINCFATTATPINCSAYAAVIMRFQHNYRWWQDARGVQVSNDGGTTWSDYPMTYSGASGNTFPNGNPYPAGQNSLNPNMETVNITADAGSQAAVLIRFYYDDADIWGWWWAVDDVQLFEQPADDIQLLSAYFVGDDNNGIEYGMTPTNHLSANYVSGGQVYNFGTADASNVTVDAVYTPAITIAQASIATIPSDSTEFLEVTETPTLTTGVYTGVYTAQSTGDALGGPEFADNVYPRNFEVTTNIYAQDGVPNNPATTENLGLIGTGSFNGATDGLVLATEYDLKSSDMVSGIRVLLDANTVEGGSIYGSIKDTSLFWQNDMTSLYQSDEVVVSAADVAQGYVDILFNQVETLNAGSYYAAVELYSNTNTNDIFVVDDETVIQPSTASAIYIAGDQSYTNGEALGIRLLMGDQWGAGVNENTLDGVSVYPNPSTGIINVRNTNNAAGTIAVYDMVGKVVYTSEMGANNEINLSANGTGVYVVKVNSEAGSFVERVVIK